MIRDYDETQYLTKRYKNANTDEAKEKRVKGLRRILPKMKLSKPCKQCGKIMNRGNDSYSVWRGRRYCSESCVRISHRASIEKGVAKRMAKKRVNPKSVEVTNTWLYGKPA